MNSSDSVSVALAGIDVARTEEGLIHIVSGSAGTYATVEEFAAFLTGAKRGDFDGLLQRDVKGAPLDVVSSTVTVA